MGKEKQFEFPQTGRLGFKWDSTRLNKKNQVAQVQVLKQKKEEVHQDISKLWAQKTLASLPQPRRVYLALEMGGQRWRKRSKRLKEYPKFRKERERVLFPAEQNKCGEGCTQSSPFLKEGKKQQK